MKTRLKQVIFVSAGVLILTFLPLLGNYTEGTNLFKEPLASIERFAMSQYHSMLPISSPNPPERVISTMLVIVTAYSSTPDQTDSTPFITASGTTVRDGIVAANFLAIGTKIKLPDIYGDRIFTVEDRMHPRKSYMVDIWFASYSEAKEFGAKHTYIEILES